jgi:predicted Zn-dependent protease with MMP-like domain
MIHLDKASFEQLVALALEELPDVFRENLNNVTIVIEDEPKAEQVRKMKLRPGRTLFGLYEGIPQTKRLNYTLVLRDKITIFQRPMEYFCSTRAEIKEQVKKTVLHEIGHHFGMSEEQLGKI